ncbi:MAG: ABC-F family ATP-binding cassette domain-containing protein [Clostridiales bacterium]|nr:ABC-F family ATP-binding cassette domain-containing protein [Clostridiales bacterium]
MIILDIAHVAKSFGTDEVLKDVSFSVQTGERIGLVGTNGSGKTTLLRILNQELQADEGVISYAKNIKIGYLTQIFQPEAGKSVLDLARSALSNVFAIEQKMRVLELQMGDPAREDELDLIYKDYARLTEQFEREGGYEADSQVLGVLSGLGFTPAQQMQEASTLSGGELTRLGLVMLLLQKPDLLLLDEPTNHLDMNTLSWLENYLSDYAGSVILVSHDRYFLNAVCTGMVELLFGQAEVYHGNYSSYLRQRDERFTARNKAYQQQQKEIMRQRAIIARFRSFNREKSIRAAESREKALERMEILDRPQEEKQVMFRFETKRLLGEIALQGECLSKSFGERTLFSDIEIDIRGGDRVALIGPNGIGKTTLLRCLMGKEKLDAGEVRFGPKAQVGYFDQRQQELKLDNDVLNEVWDAFPLLNQSQIRGALGLFMFSGDDVFVPVGLLSGGEKSRVSLVKLMLKKDNFLLLDEPTNHLDADSREALEKALDGYEGTILAVSHDRYFINRFANRILELDAEGITAYEGNYDDYLQENQRQILGDLPDAPEKTKTELAKERKAEREMEARAKELKEQVLKAELLAHQAQEQLDEALDLQADPAIYSDPVKASRQAQLCKALQVKVDKAFAAWEKAEQQMDEFTCGNIENRL